jgi:predicted transcriptional regulator
MRAQPILQNAEFYYLAEDKADIVAAMRAEERRRAGEEYLASEMADRLLAGESALRVWRKHRGMTLQTLSKAVGVGVSQLSDMENAKRRGAPALWRKLAEALNVSADDILPQA